MNRTQASAAAEHTAEMSTAGFGNLLAGAAPDEEISLAGPQGKVIRLSKVLEVNPEELMPNPANNRPMPSQSRLESMGEKMNKVGILHNLIVRNFQAGDPKERTGYSSVIICGHVRRESAINHSKLNRVPIRRIISPATVSRELEIFLFDVENDDRRNDRENLNEKLEWVRKNFGERIAQRKKGKGGARRGKNKQANLAKQIEIESQGDIPEGSAKRYILMIEAEQANQTARAAEPTKTSTLLKETRALTNWIAKHDLAFAEAQLQSFVEKLRKKKTSLEKK